MDHDADEPSQSLGTAALAGAAIGAGALYQFALLFPLALGLALPVLFYNNGLLAGVSVLGFLILGWVIQPGSGAMLSTISRDDAPALYDWLDSLCRRFNAPRIHAIALNDELNAGAMELHRGMSLRPTRRVLVLGMPLLATLGPQALEAVVAHELGHFSRRHGRLGHWLYRTRQAWASHLDDAIDKNSSAWERASAEFAQWFVPWFSAHSFAHARRCEFEADRLAAQTVGPQSMGAALAQVALASIRHRRWARRGHVAMQLERPKPPADWLQASAAAIAPSAPTFEELRQMLNTTATADTHPTLVARWNALGLATDTLEQTCRPEPICAGQTWLDPRWEALLARSNAAWAAQQTPLWNMGHAVLQALDARVQTLRATGTVDIERLRLEWALGNTHETGAIATALLDAGTTAPSVWYRLAAARLTEGRGEAAIDLLRQCIAHSAGWVSPARALMATEAEQLGLGTQARKENIHLLSQADGRRLQAAEALIGRVESGEAEQPRLDSTQRAAWVAALHQHPAVRNAWCVSTSIVWDNKRAYAGQVLIVRLAPDAMTAMSFTEDQCAEQIELALSRVVDADVVVCVRTSFTTEGLPPTMQHRLDSLPESVLL